jgi:glucosamine 6-phosphate synthetase-like amidotransferase/phosphosugar isomerase protein
MIKIILILALLQYIYNFIFGYKSNILSCGIFGQATNKAENLDVNGVHILGIYNIERGKMSCGLSWDGDIQYGIGVDKLYTDFIVDREIKPIKIPIMIGHTRQPSYGFTVTEDNAHPFGFGTSKDGKSYDFLS